jgi:hypothetical protein
MKHGLETWRLWGQCFDGVLRIKRGASVDGSRLLSDALSGLPAGGLYLNRNLFAELAEGFGAAGQTAEGLTLINDAIARVERTEEEWCFAELLREKGELLLLRAAPSAVAEAEACFQRALDVARRQDALAWELRAATGLARLSSLPGLSSPHFNERIPTVPARHRQPMRVAWHGSRARRRKATSTSR